MASPFFAWPKDVSFQYTMQHTIMVLPCDSVPLCKCLWSPSRSLVMGIKTFLVCKVVKINNGKKTVHRHKETVSWGGLTRKTTTFEVLSHRELGPPLRCRHRFPAVGQGVKLCNGLHSVKKNLLATLHILLLEHSGLSFYPFLWKSSKGQCKEILNFILWILN